MKLNRLAVAMSWAVVACSIGAASAAAVKVNLTTLSPPNSANVKNFFGPLADKINQAANGSIEVVLRNGLTIANHRNVFERTVNDVVQIGWVLHGRMGGRFPRTNVASLPFLVQSSEEGAVALWRLYRTGLLDEEYGDLVPLAFHVHPQSQVHFVKQPKTIDDLKGLRIGASTRLPLDVVDKLGGAPISTMPGRFYETLQHGTIDGILTAWAGNSIFKYSEVTSFHIETNLGAASGMLFLTKKKFDSLPAGGRKALLASADEQTSRDFGRHLDGLQQQQRDRVTKDPRHTIVTLSPEQDAAWRSTVEPVIASWAKSRPNGKEILATYRKIVSEVRAELGKK